MALLETLWNKMVRAGGRYREAFYSLDVDI